MQTTTNELIEQARGADLVDYLRKCNYHLEKIGDEIYVKEKPGFCVNASSGEWYDHYSSQGGKNAIDCLVKVFGDDFKTAASELTGQDLSAGAVKNSAKKVKENSPRKVEPVGENYEKTRGKKQLIMPPKNENTRQMYAYFCKTRGLPNEVVTEFIRAGLLYQSAGETNFNAENIAQKSKFSNAVFIHKDEKGEVIGGEVQGLNSFKRFKGIATGTGQSAFEFIPAPSKDGKIKKAFLFESAIDLMSFYAFCKDKNKLDGVALISMAGLKPTVPKRLESEGVQIFSCVDNDDAGRKFEADNGFKRLTNYLEKEGVKDWNDYLILKSANVSETKIDLQREEKIERRAKN